MLGVMSRPIPPGFWYLLISGKLRLKLFGLSLERSLNLGDLRSSPQIQEGFEHFSHFLMDFGDFDDFEISGNRDKLGRSNEEFIILLRKLFLKDFGLLEMVSFDSQTKLIRGTSCQNKSRLGNVTPVSGPFIEGRLLPVPSGNLVSRILELKVCRNSSVPFGSVACFDTISFIPRWTLRWLQS